MTHPNEELLDRFYGAFAQLDAETMAACYAPGATFSDPVFPNLSGDEPGDMWRMLTARAQDFRVELAERSAGDATGTAHWIAHYTFAQTGRPVVNDVHATFRFADGLIVDHRDSFDFHRWARQALGPPGLLLGWTPFLRKKVQAQARAGLDDFRARR
jgi:ketosteroid isomerase-like protein